MIKALVCLSLATLAKAFPAQAPSKPIQTTDLVSGAVYFYGRDRKMFEWQNDDLCTLHMCGGDRNG